ncbi:DUF4422 domain-containing protein [Lactococcus lactis]|uniref:DUF4422 domain-containing protein n=1 Tax=Lactococcus lactis TaxID=1358 RepID=UPI000559B36F|nr:DUF4422 domain-containing protein [Lactococcus lactis]AJA56771.1 lipopolysaccharide biosynthesis glycosyltransferase [Lactococcus lactis subsp. lactis]WBM78344.1 DUF4422 domain-containing protein [Lactococcus lactis]WSP32794.1 DUF4422 domain-containing protein [Lactococcus lactis subsp. lactis]
MDKLTVIITDINLMTIEDQVKSLCQNNLSIIVMLPKEDDDTLKTMLDFIIKKYKKYVSIKIVDFDPDKYRNNIEVQKFGANLSTSDYLLFPENDMMYSKKMVSNLKGDLISLELAEFDGEFATVSKEARIIPKNLEEFLESVESSKEEYLLGNKIISKKIFTKVVSYLEKLEKNSDINFLRNNQPYDNLYLVTALYAQLSGAVITESKEIAYLVTEAEEEQLSSLDLEEELNNLEAQFLAIENIINQVSDFSEKFIDFKNNIIGRFLWKLSNHFGSTEVLDKARVILNNPLIGLGIELEGDFEKVKADFIDLDGKNPADLKAKIYVSMHKPSYVPENKYLTPIQVGTSLAKKEIPDVLYDNVGENISSKNKRYCELTAQYWAWKHDKDSDYLGFWHYRRYMSFDTGAANKETIWGVIPREKITAEELKEFSITENDMAEVIDGSDLIIPDSWRVIDTVNLEKTGKLTHISLYDHWVQHLEKSDIDTLIAVISEKYPDYTRALFEVLYSDIAPFYNMFIMKRSLFEEYNEFCFGVLEEIEKQVDHEKYSVELYRTLGHIGERLVAIFAKHLELTRKDLTILRLPVVQWSDTRPLPQKIEPVFAKNNIPVVMACNDSYMRYTTVLLQSILENASAKNNYDISILHTDISIETQNRALKYFNKKNFSLKFIDVSAIISQYGELKTNAHISVETYYRFLIPELFTHDKVIYIDCDTVVEKDIAELYAIDIKDNYAGAVKDFDFIASNYSPERQKLYKKEILNYLNLRSFEDYFQAGVLVLNLTAIREDFKTQDFIDLVQKRKWRYMDQDILNLCFKNRVQYLPEEWNVITLMENNSVRAKIIQENLPYQINEAYNKSRQAPAVVHYAGSYKPWFYKNSDMAETFWHYAQSTSYYTELLLEASNPSKEFKLIFTSDAVGRENAALPFLKLIPEKNDFSTSYFVLDVLVLDANLDQSKVGSVLIIVNSDTLQSRWLQDDRGIWENFGFRMVGSNVEVWARYNGQWNGYVIVPKAYETRSFSLGKIEAINENFTPDLQDMPF